MGVSASKITDCYVRKLEPNQVASGETPVYISPHPEREAILKEARNKTLHDSYKGTLVQRASSLAIHWRIVDPKTKQPTNNLAHMTWGDFRQQAEAFGSALLEKNLVPVIREYKDYALRFVAMYAKQTIEYFITDVACGIYGLTVLPVYDTLGEEATNFVFKQTGVEVCVVDCKHVPALLNLKKTSKSFEKLKCLVILDSNDWPYPEQFGAELDGMTLLRFGDLVEFGKSRIRPWAQVTPESIYAFSYTSGTTGEPKAAMLSHGNLSNMFPVLKTHIRVSPDDFHLTYLPMAHLIERILFNTMVYYGANLCVSCGDITKLKEDLEIFRPTIFVSVPRLFNRFYDTILSNVKAKGKVASKLFNRGLKIKLQNLHKSAKFDHWLYDRLIFNKIKNVFGGRVRMMGVGSAPISAQTLDTLKAIFCCPIFEVYGQTENTGGAFLTSEFDPFSGHVGGPTFSYEFKLVDVPDLGYFATDVDEHGNPQPRGEIWTRGPCVIQGYYKADEINANTFTPDGWLMSGDIGMLVGPEKRLMIIDRKKNIFKLSQGEYIAPEKLESLYRLAHPSISAIFVYGNSLQNYLVAILNVEGPALIDFAASLNIHETNAESLAENPKVQSAYLEVLNKEANTKKLNSLEKIKALRIETKPFQSLGLLTEALKIKRHEVARRYQEAFDEMYAKGADK